MVRSITPDTLAPTITARTPAAGARRHQRRRRIDGEVQRADGGRLLHRLELPAQGLAQRCRADERRIRPGDEHGDADAAERASSTETTYTVKVKGGAGGVTDYAGNPLAADSTWTLHDGGLAAAHPRRRVDGEPVRRLCRRDAPERRPGRVHDDRRGVPLTGAARAVRRRRPRQHAAQRGAGDDAHRLGQRRRQPRRDAARQAAREPARADRRGHDAGERLPPGRHRHRAGGRDRRQHDPVPRHRRPLHAERRHLGGDALLERDDRDDEPGRDAALGRLERRPGGRVHLRPRALRRLHAPGQSRLGRAGARRRVRDSSRRPLLRRQGRRRPARLDRHEQDRDPAGGRAAAAPAEPDHGDGARQAAAAALLVPAARREGSRRPQRRRPLAEPGARRHCQPTSTATRR